LKKFKEEAFEWYYISNVISIKKEKMGALEK